MPGLGSIDSRLGPLASLMIWLEITKWVVRDSNPRPAGIRVALTLMKDGYSANEAINEFHSRTSPWALSNKSFEIYLAKPRADQEIGT